MERFFMEKNNLNAETVRSLMETDGYDVHTEHTVDSTNNILKRLAAEGAPHGYMLIAQEQTAGRGRLGRSFFSPQSGIYMSLLLRPHTPPQETLFFTTTSAVAICRAIEKITSHRAQIKWVNDVYIGTRKVCGILTEAAVAGGMTDWVVVGIGVNITAPRGGFPAEIADRAGALFEDGECPEGFINLLGAAMADELCRAFSEDRVRIAADYRARSMVVGREVTAIDGGRERRCTVLDVNDDASLAVRFEDGTEGLLYSGEVSVKL
jgi:BirA family biotin operon repressor/biotin-[acetyl-CoA-carboxylase] ligase